MKQSPTWYDSSKCQIKWDIVSNFCGLFRMSELYFSYIFHFLFVLMEFLWEKGYWFARNVTPVYSIWAIVRLRKEYILLASQWCFCHGIFSSSVFNFMTSTLQLICISILSVTLFKLSTRSFINLILVMHVKSSYEMVYNVNISKKINCVRFVPNYSKLK